MFVGGRRGREGCGPAMELVNFQVRAILKLLVWIIVVGAGWGCLDSFSLIYPSFFFIHLSGRRFDKG